MSSPCSAASAPTISGLSGPECAPSPSASPTLGAAPCSPSTGPECPASLTFDGWQALMFPDLSISSRAASPARTSALRERAKGSTAPEAVCGSSTCGSCPSCDPLGFSLRTFLLSALAGLTPWRLVWNRKATPSGRSWWVLGRSGLRTGEIGFGSSRDWITPTVSDADKPNGDGPKATLNQSQWSNQRLRNQVRPWATPTSRDWRSTSASEATHDRNARPLSEQAGKDWPTPTAGDSKASGSRNAPGSKAHPGVSLTDSTTTGDSAGRLDAENPSTNGKRPGSLNPDWVETLQGLPLGWTDLPAETVSELWATRTRLTSRKRSGGGS